jgi:ribonuclease J
MHKNEKNKAIWSAIKTPEKEAVSTIKKDQPKPLSASTKPGVHPAPKRTDGKKNQNRRSNNHRPRMQERPKRTAFTHTRRRESTLNIPAVEAGVLRIIPIGGVEQVGQNMTAIEYGNDIIIVDAGFQFVGDDTPGVDYIIPNTKYLEDRKANIRGMFITHGHLDHIGAIPFIIEKIGNPPIYSREFGAAMILKRQEEFPHLPKIQMNIVGPEDTIRVGEHFVVRESRPPVQLCSRLFDAEVPRLMAEKVMPGTER